MTDRVPLPVAVPAESVDMNKLRRLVFEANGELEELDTYVRTIMVIAQALSMWSWFDGFGVA